MLFLNDWQNKKFQDNLEKKILRFIPQILFKTYKIVKIKKNENR